ncbi:sigma-E processing peptidase SpoIIGA [Clostridium sardiniense]|uniref:Sporulation sigma-E factor-processing peptidase n=1 Tax=Clostridium sardiniense TaxID=29369 RepID=A0ABS7KXM9_CLOSR|nr:sigma-E processing peptidase SpoIIGA [Clostridium sardiniense]MBY0755494.1 sigma-E processing peptidase SpoIIGA [Clostridium sardiniense]MDQ0462203.1 stage II sporulation protein GA (sporulation sigma-E factor processing peptidase) [Clostridium sardiniense]
MDIYVDILLIENFLVNLFLLTISYRVLREMYSFKKCIFAAALGALYTLTMVFNELNWLSNNLFQVIVALSLAYIPLINKKIGNALKCGATFIASACVLSGICFKIAVITNEYSIKNGIMINDFKVKYLIICVAILFVALERITSYIREKNIIRDFFYDIEITLKDKVIMVKGFLDSGNELREPITNLPCILVEEGYLNTLDIKNEGVFYIPYSAIGYNGSLKGFKVNNIKLKKSGETFREIDAILCPCKDTLSRDNEFNALLSRGVI